MHPEVEIKCAQATGLDGKSVSDIHHGLIGETDIKFSSSADCSTCDVLFICNAGLTVAELNQIRHTRPGLKIIMLEAPAGLDMKKEGIVYGLPEINRKPLVRGATAALIPHPFASMALVALFPFASHLLLGGDIDISVSAPEAIIADSDTESDGKEISGVLHDIQQSFNGRVNIESKPSDARRSALMEISFDCPLNLEQMLDLYNIYDDHRFSFVTTRRVGVSEVAGTNKCVITVGRTGPGRASLSVAADCRLRGGSGEAVHVMNLMFGLHEKTGLNLKAIDFDKI